MITSLVPDRSAAPGTSSPRLPSRVVPTTAPNNDHVTRTHAKSRFRLQPKDRLSLLAEPQVSPIPPTCKAALLDPHWSATMKDEFHALLQNDTCQLVSRPHGANVV